MIIKEKCKLICFIYYIAVAVCR